MKKLDKKAFTLIELLIVIAIIGILFIVLVSKVDFATDKAKASGVQTDFRSFQLAFDTVAKENAGFNTFGYNTGDTKREDFDTALAGYTYTNETSDKGDGKRNSYDEGDKNLNGKQDGLEVWTGKKVYTESWTEVYTLSKPGDVSYDPDVLFALESAINANLDPKLHIRIDDEGVITMVNQARDPWKNEYHGIYISNAAVDGMDRGAIVIYSNGANGKCGSEHAIANGVVSITVPGNNINGKDDYSIVSLYTSVNGFGEVQNMTTGFSSNMQLSASTGEVVPMEQLEGHNQTYYTLTPADLSFRSMEPLSEFQKVLVNGNEVSPSNYTLTEGSTIVTLHADYLATLPARTHRIVIVSENSSAAGNFKVVEQGLNAQHFYYNVPYMCGTLDENGELMLDSPMGIMMRNDGTVYLTWYESVDCFPVIKTTYTVDGNIMNVKVTPELSDMLGLDIDVLPGEISEDGLNVSFDGTNFAMSTAVAMSEGEYFYAYAWFIMGPFVLDNTKESYSLPLYNYSGLDLPFAGTFRDCVNLKQMELPLGAKSIGNNCFINCVKLQSVTIPVTVTSLSRSAFENCTSLTTIVYKGTIEQWNKISKASGWNSDIPATEVVCSDGVVNLK